MGLGDDCDAAILAQNQLIFAVHKSAMNNAAFGDLRS
jgi:hypothetical protein